MLVDRLIDQLDTLVPFLALSREDVFQILNEHRDIWFADNPGAPALLLGYSYFENFLTELLASILRNRPSMLPKDRKVKYSEILDSPDMDALINKLVRREIHELTYMSMEEIIKELRSKYNFTITEEEERELIKLSLIRNCILHNSSRCDSRLCIYDDYQDGDEFEVSEDSAHEYGWVIRELVHRMYDEARKKMATKESIMPQGRESGARAVEYGLQTARKIAQILGGRKVGNKRSNEYEIENKSIVIKCARIRTNSVGVSYRMLKRVTAILGCFEVEENVYDIYEMKPKVYSKHMTPTRSTGSSKGRVGKVKKSVFLDRGRLLQRISIT